MKPTKGDYEKAAGIVRILRKDDTSIVSIGPFIDLIAQALAETRESARAEVVKEVLESKELNNLLHYTEHSNFCNWDGRTCECGYEPVRWAWLHYKNDLKDEDELKHSLTGRRVL